MKKETYTLQIKLDENGFLNSPREWDNVGTMVCLHNKYNLGDEHNIQADDFDGWQEIKEHLIKENGDIVILPLYLYDHSGLAISTTPFNCNWDSGQIGFIYAKKGFEDLSDEQIGFIYAEKGASDEQLAANMVSEVKNYSQYLSGDIYCYLVRDEEGDIVDSCGGYYDKEQAEDDGNSSLNNLNEEAKAENQKIDELEAKIKAVIAGELILENSELVELLNITFNNNK